VFVALEVKVAVIGNVHHHGDLLCICAAAHEVVAHLVGDGDGAIGKANGRLFHTLECPQEGPRVPLGRKHGAEELGDGLVQVQNHARSRELGIESHEHEVVGHRVHLNGREGALAMKSRELDGCQNEECVVLPEVAQNLSAAMAHREPMNIDAFDHFERRLVIVAQAYDVDIVAVVAQRLGLALYVELEGIERMPDDGDPFALGALHGVFPPLLAITRVYSPMSVCATVSNE